MEAITKKYNSANLHMFVFDTLTTNELFEVRGGGTPKTRDKDIFDFEEE